MSLKLSSDTYFDAVAEESVTPEERAGLNPPTDQHLRRTNPKRHDVREDQLQLGTNEQGKDSDIANRYDNAPNLQSSLKLNAWKTGPDPLLREDMIKDEGSYWDYVQENIYNCALYIFYSNNHSITRLMLEKPKWKVTITYNSNLGTLLGQTKWNNLTYFEARELVLNKVEELRNDELIPYNPKIAMTSDMMMAEEILTGRTAFLQTMAWSLNEKVDETNDERKKQLSGKEIIWIRYKGGMIAGYEGYPYYVVELGRIHPGGVMAWRDHIDILYTLERAKEILNDYLTSHPGLIHIVTDDEKEADKMPPLQSSLKLSWDLTKGLKAGDDVLDTIVGQIFKIEKMGSYDEMLEVGQKLINDNRDEYAWESFIARVKHDSNYQNITSKDLWALCIAAKSPSHGNTVNYFDIIPIAYLEKNERQERAGSLKLTWKIQNIVINSDDYVKRRENANKEVACMTVCIFQNPVPPVLGYRLRIGKLQGNGDMETEFVAIEDLNFNKVKKELIKYLNEHPNTIHLLTHVEEWGQQEDDYGAVDIETRGASLTASLEELDWEIDRTIETYNNSLCSLRVHATILEDTFTDKLIQRFAATNEEMNSKVFNMLEHEEGRDEIFWGTEENQLSRFKFMLSMNEELDDEMMKQTYGGKKILDIGCCLAGEKITLKDYEQVVIEDVRKDDIVLTHIGNWQKVLEPTSRFYEGKIWEFSMEGFSKRPLILTAEHPLYVLREEKLQFIEAAKILLTDLLVTPRVASKIEEETYLEINGSKIEVDNDLLRYIGLYIAEGYSTKQGKQNNKKYGSAFCFHVDELGLIDFIKRYTKDKFGVTCRWYQDIPRHSIEIKVNNQLVGDFLRKYGGEYSHFKRLHSDLFSILTNEQLLEIVKGYWEGDGCIMYVKSENKYLTKGGYETHHINNFYQGSAGSASPILINQIWRILVNNGYHSNRSTDRSKEGNIVYNLKSSTIETLQIFNPSIKRKFAKKVLPHKIDEKYIYHKIKKIRAGEYKGMVYNLKVEGDNSYVVNDIAVHNCGYGELYTYLRRHTGAKPREFFGIDILSQSIDKAQKLADKTAHFEVRDILKNPLPENSYDYVTAIGIFALTVDNYFDYVKQMLVQMYSTCKIMTICDFPLQGTGDFIGVKQKDVENVLINYVTPNYKILKDKRNNEFVVYLLK